MILTPAFAKTRDKPFRNCAKRWLRLQIPIFVALTFAFILVTLTRGVHIEASKLNNSTSWVASYAAVRPTITSFLQESFWASLLAGYENISVFASFGGTFFVGKQALIPPLWSLNIEFWGSILIIILAYLRPFVWAHRAAILFFLLLFAVNSLVLFVLGHLIAIACERESKLSLTTRNVIGLCLFLAGIEISLLREELISVDLFLSLNALTAFKAQTPFHLAGMIAAIFVFCGVVIAPWLRQIFCVRPLLWLGRISFGLYLIHVPILFTITAVLQVTLTPHLAPVISQAGAALTAAALGFGLTLVLATLFTKWIDDPAVTLGRMIVKPDRPTPTA